MCWFGNYAHKLSDVLNNENAGEKDAGEDKLAAKDLITNCFILPPLHNDSLLTFWHSCSGVKCKYLFLKQIFV